MCEVSTPSSSPTRSSPVGDCKHMTRSLPPWRCSTHSWSAPGDADAPVNCQPMHRELDYAYIHF